MTRKAVAPQFGPTWRRAVRSLRAAALHFGHGAASAEDEAAWMLIHALGWPVMESFAAFGSLARRPVPPDAMARFNDLVVQRIATRKPVAYLLGEAWLQGVRFVVDERVIVPRSFIAELLPEALEPWLEAEPRRVADICTGSGCLGILAALRWPQARVLCTDISADALKVAEANVRLHRLSDRVELLHSDLLDAMPTPPAGQGIDLLLCNPPYVNAAAMRALPQEYQHEPALALAGGSDGMELVRRLLADAPRVLAPTGLVVVEIGHERAHFEAAFPRLPVIWLPTSAGHDSVFLVHAAALREAA